MNKATCRGCGARIVWIKTPAGKAMPCDPSPVYYKADPEGKDRIVTTRGEVVACTITTGADATDAGYRPHWATCPQAGHFKKERMSRPPADLGQLCPKCIGAGEVRVMEAARYIVGPCIRVQDTVVPCDRCGGLGYLKGGNRHE